MVKAIWIFLFFSMGAIAGIYEPNVVWSKKEITVCFLDERKQFENVVQYQEKLKQFTPASIPFFNENLIINAVNLNFRPETTGIHFVGWKKCSETAHYDVIILQPKKVVRRFWFDRKVSFHGQASIGERGVYDQHGFYKNPTGVSYVAFKFLNEHVILHEFGHLAGLRHEHILEEADQDPNCGKWANYEYESYCRGFQNPQKCWHSLKLRKGRDKIMNSTMVHASYDKSSIMNYCRANSDEAVRNASLSPQDIATLQYLY